ncbi:MAG TPA: hypothetical protein VIJ82_00585 [Streptosporangiaceae bacterium]
MTGDLLLTALRDARHRRDQADQDIRLLLAYAREVVLPRPYRLADLAEASGMSVSGVRTAYTAADVDHVTALLAARHLAAEEHGTPAA